MELSLLEILHPKYKAVTFRLMEHLGKRSMMYVILLPFVVVLVKLGNLIEFRFGPAVIAFALCVLMSIVTSICFDLQASWEENA